MSPSYPDPMGGNRAIGVSHRVRHQILTTLHGEEDVPRSLRMEYHGAFYHVMARGNRREAKIATQR